MKKILLSLILAFIVQNIVWAQTATVSYPLAIGREGCSSGNEQVHFYTYNASTNVITSITSTTGLTGRYRPQLRIGTSGGSGGIQRFTTNYSSISYNPADHNIYFLWTTLSSFTGSGTVPRTYVWRWPAGTKPTGTSPRLDTLCSVQADLLGVAFDNNGNSYVIEFSGEPNGVPHTAYLRSIDFTTSTMGPADNLVLTGGATIYESGSGDVAMTPSGQMFFIVNNKLFTPDYTAYTGTGSNITCTYIDTVVNSATGNFVGLTYADGETISAYSGGGCPFFETDMITAATSNITKSGTYSAADLATIVSGVGAAKKLVSVTPTATPNQYTVVYDIYVKNYGNTGITNVQVTDNLDAINPIPFDVSSVTTSFVSNPAGLVLNPSFNGTTNQDLLNGTGTLPNFPVANSSCTIRITCTLSGILRGIVYNNSATARAFGYNSVALTDVSTDGTMPDLNSNDKPDDVGENQPTPLLIALVAQTPPCASLTNILISQDFGTGTGLATSIPGAVTAPTGVSVNSQTTGYTPSNVQPLAYDNLTLTNNANNANTSDFISLTDHTGNANGRMLVVNADADAKFFYRIDFNAGLCANQQYSVSFYAAFIGNSAYQTVCNGFGGFRYPKVKIRVRNGAVAGNPIITEATTADITSTSWGQYGLKFISPASYTRIIIELINDGLGGCGNDIAFDDIQFGSCDPLPVVGLNHINAGCLGTSASFTVVLSDPAAILGTPDYQWQISNDGIGWSNIAAAPNAATYTIPSVGAGDVNKYYRALVASAGNLGNPNCRYASPTYFLKAGCDIDDDDDGIPDTVESGGVDPLDDDDLDNIPNYRDANYPGFVDTNGDGVNDNFDWDLDGVINELDLDSDNDGIPDVVEAGGVDTNGDGKIDNYTDTDFDGFSQNVDANTSGKDLSGNGLAVPDLDGDGVPNYFDLDSDNDGIPDVVEAYGADSDNNGIIDGYSDTDSDGFSDNKDGDVGNDGIAENAANTLLRTGTDPDNNGRANTYPYNNMDNDTKANPYDLDSDGDGITDVKEAQFTDADWNGRVDGAINSKGRNAALAALGSLTIPNTDGVGRPNPFDIDSDDDGIPDNVEGLTTLGYLLPGTADTDSDGILNAYDNFSGFGGDGIHPVDTDADGSPDYYDSDTDSDGMIDRLEGNDLNFNGIPDDNVTLTGLDTDGDGLDNRFDNDNLSAKGTSAYMGNGGTTSGDATPGSITTVQHTTAVWGCTSERDWRCTPYVLSCEFLTVTASVNNTTVSLKWDALCRQEIDYFIIERSTDRSTFTQVGTVTGRPTVNEVEKYNTTDDVSIIQSITIFYRIKAVMKSGRANYSTIVPVRKQGMNNVIVQLMPNPAKDMIQVVVNSRVSTKATVSIVDAAGKEIYRFKENLMIGNNTLTYSQVALLPSGLYYLRLYNDEINQAVRFNIVK